MKKLIFTIIIFFIMSKVSALDTSAECIIAMDIDSNKIFYSENIHRKRPIASISKIMTAIIAIESDKFYNTVEIGTEIEDTYGSGIYIKQGEHLKIEDLVYGLMLRSGNDAAAAIAHHVGGSRAEFIKKMNEKAKELGMKNTVFNNPSGLDDKGGNISTAYDMALLTSYAMKNDSYKKITSTKIYKLETDMNVYRWTNKNKLLNIYKHTTGGKTGYTDIAKRTLVTTATKDDLNIVIVTLNDGNDFEDHKKIYEETFSYYKSYLILQKGKINILNETHYQNAYFYLKDDFKYPLNNNEKDNIVLKFKINKKISYKDDDKIGIVEVHINNEKKIEKDIFIKKIPKQNKNFFQKIFGWFRW